MSLPAQNSNVSHQENELKRLLSRSVAKYLIVGGGITCLDIDFIDAADAKRAAQLMNQIHAGHIKFQVHASGDHIQITNDSPRIFEQHQNDFHALFTGDWVAAGKERNFPPEAEYGEDGRVNWDQFTRWLATDEGKASMPARYAVMKAHTDADNTLEALKISLQKG